MLVAAFIAAPAVVRKSLTLALCLRLFSLCLPLRPLSFSWTNGLTVKSAVAHATSNEETLKTLLDLAAQYHKRLEEAEGKTAEELVVANVVGDAAREQSGQRRTGRRGQEMRTRAAGWGGTDAT